MPSLFCNLPTSGNAMPALAESSFQEQVSYFFDDLAERIF